MTIKDIELFHGAVLAKIIRGERPVSLKLLEFNAEASSAAYFINAEVIIYVKHSKSPRSRSRDYSHAWLFSFSKKHLDDFRKLAADDNEVYVVLVCGNENTSKSVDMHYCFLDRKQLETCIDLYSAQSQAVTVGNVKNGNLRVWGNLNGPENPVNVQKGALAKWEVPGS